MMDWNGHNMTSGGWIFSILAMIILVALVVATIAWFKRPDRGPAVALSARDILDRRLASGEIKLEQYEQLRRTLAVRPDPGPASAAVPRVPAPG